MRDLAAAPLPLDALLAFRAADSPDMPLLAMPEFPGVVTAAGLHRLAGAAASWLAERGIGPGDRIAMWGQNSVAWIVWLCAAAWRGAALVALHPMLEPADLGAALARAKPRWLIVDATARGRALGEMAQAVVATIPAQEPMGVTIMPGGDGRLDFGSVVDTRAAPPPPCGSLDAPLNLQFTSGSTGKPKAVVLSHRALIVNAILTARAAGIVPGDRIASPLPLVHAAGLSSGFVLALATGALWCTMHRFQPVPLLELIEEHRCTVLQGVPTMFKALLDLPRLDRADVAALRLGFIGGAACPPDLCRAIMERLALRHLAIVYGQTEFGPTISLTDGREPPDLALNSVGHALRGTDVAIVDPRTGAPVADGGEGEIRVRGPTLMSGYFEDAAATAAAVSEDGWLRTGDLGRIARGCLQVTGRIKELIIRGGENISPYAVEDALRGAPGVVDAVAVPAPSAHWGEEICAVLLAGPDGVDPSAIRRFAEAALPRFMRPDRYVVRREFPILPSGKIDRAAIRRAVAAGEWS
jgi:fatty-acyl-CoA synthase